MTASDISNAFSRTCRLTQLFELMNVKEHGKLFQFQHRNYDRTLTVLRTSTEFSSIIQEMLGSKQGGQESALHFKSYIRKLVRLMIDADIKYNIMGTNIDNILCADDGVNMLEDEITFRVKIGRAHV